MTPATATMMQAFGRPLFLVHNGGNGAPDCKRYVTGGVQLVGTAALTGIKLALKKNAPQALRLFESVIALRSQNVDR